MKHSVFCHMSPCGRLAHRRAMSGGIDVPGRLTNCTCSRLCISSCRRARGQNAVDADVCDISVSGSGSPPWAGMWVCTLCRLCLPMGVLT